MFNWFNKKIAVPDNQAPATGTGVPGKVATSSLPNEYAAHKKRGNEYLAQGRLEEATECYRQAVVANPGHAEGFLNLGFALKEQHLFEEAEHALKQAVLLAPQMVDAYYFLGSIAQERGNPAKAIEYFQKSLELKPDFEIVYGDLCQLMFQSGQLESATKVIQQGLALFPQSAQFHCYLGNLYVAEKKLEQAVSCYRKALAIQPDYAEVHVLLGNIFKEQGELDDALDCYRKALALRPDSFEINNNLGSTFHDQGNLNEAETCYRKALELNPEYVEANNNLGVIFRKRGKLSEAEACYRKVLALRPDSPATCNNLANLFRLQGNLDEAIAYYRKALELKPDDAEVYNNLGAIFQDHLNMDDAVACFSKALMLRPNDPGIHNNLGFALQVQGKPDEALSCFRQAIALKSDFHAAKINLVHLMQLVCEWKDLQLLSEEVRRSVRELPPTGENRIPPFSFLAVSGSTPSEQKLCASNWAQGVCQNLNLNREAMGFNFRREPRQKIHIGYLSADFRNHPVAHLMAEVIKIHDREHFRISAYSYGPDDASGAMRKRLERAFDRFVDIREFTHEAAARQIYADQVDILVDLTGYTQFHRSAILALRPAPVQAEYLGYLGTMGADFMDYIIADRFLIPPEHQRFFSEKVAYLSSYQANDRQSAIAETPTRKSCGLPEEGIVFCCFNQTYKILPDIFEIWMRLLKAVPGSVFWIFAPNPVAISNLQREAQAKGVAPERLIFAESVPLDKHLARLKCADLFLDTLPYNAGTTASNALWAGLPVITCTGETFSSRMAGSLLIALDVPELITYNLEDYYALALELATDKNKYTGIRNKIMANRESARLFDSTKFTRDLENVYQRMWDEYTNSPHSN